MNTNKARGIIILFSLLSLVAALAFKHSLIAILLMTVCMLSAVIILYQNLGELTELSGDNPKMKTLKLVTVFNAGVLIVCAIFAILLGTNVIHLADERYFAAVVVSTLILFAGNVSPKLPFSRHTGLRLPWTVTDENTWIVAHRILGYISLPLAFIYLAGVSVVSNFEIWTLIVLMLWVGIPGGLSYAFFRRGMKR